MVRATVENTICGVIISMGQHRQRSGPCAMDIFQAPDLIGTGLFPFTCRQRRGHQEGVVEHKGIGFTVVQSLRWGTGFQPFIANRLSSGHEGAQAK